MDAILKRLIGLHSPELRFQSEFAGSLSDEKMAAAVTAAVAEAAIDINQQLHRRISNIAATLYPLLVEMRSREWYGNLTIKSICCNLEADIEFLGEIVSPSYKSHWIGE